MHDGSRAVDRGHDADLITRAGAAAGSPEALKEWITAFERNGSALRGLATRHRSSVPNDEIVTMHMFARNNGYAGNANGLAVFAYHVPRTNRDDRKLMTGGHGGLGNHAALERLARRDWSNR